MSIILADQGGINDEKEYSQESPKSCAASDLPTPRNRRRIDGTPGTSWYFVEYLEIKGTFALLIVERETFELSYSS